MSETVPPLRQSGVETGVAVVAAIPLPPEPQHLHEPDEPPEALSESAGVNPPHREGIARHRASPHGLYARYRHTLKDPTAANGRSKSKPRRTRRGDA